MVIEHFFLLLLIFLMLNKIFLLNDKVLPWDYAILSDEQEAKGWK